MDKTRMLRTAVVLGVLITISAAGVLAEGNTSKEFLTLESTIRLPSVPRQGAWAANGRQVLIDQPWEGTLRVADLESGRLLDQPVAKNVGFHGFVASPDGRFVALARRAEVRLLNAATLEDISRLAQPDPAECYFQETNSMQFTNDGRFLWISCAYLVSPLSTYSAAIKIQIPEMQIVDRLALQSPIPGAPLSTRSGRIERHQDSLSLVSRVSVSTPPQQNPNASWQVHFFYTGHDLESKKELFPPIKLDGLGYEGRTGFIEARDGTDKTLLLRISSKADGQIIIAVDCETGRVLSSITETDMEKEGTPANIQTIIGVRGREFIIGGRLRARPAIPNDPLSLGSLLVFDAKSLAVFEHKYSGRVSWMGLSPDGKRLATLSSDQLRIYRVSH